MLPPLATADDLTAFCHHIMTAMGEPPWPLSNAKRLATFTLADRRCAIPVRPNPYLSSARYYRKWQAVIRSDGKGLGEGIPLDQQLPPGDDERLWLAMMAQKYPPVGGETSPSLRSVPGWQDLKALCEADGLELYDPEISETGYVQVTLRARTPAHPAPPKIGLPPVPAGPTGWACDSIRLKVTPCAALSLTTIYMAA